MGASHGGTSLAATYRTSDYTLWHARIEESKRERDKHESAWEATLKAKRGRHFRKGDTKAGAQPVNLPSNYLRVTMPHLLPRDRQLEVTVAPRRPGPEYDRSARIQADRINGLMAEIRMMDAARAAARACFSSAGILKTGFHARTGLVGPTESSQAPGEKVSVDVDLELAGHEEYLDPGMPYCCWVPATRFYPEAGATSLSDCRSCAHEVFLSVEALKRDPRWKGVADSLKASNATAPRSTPGWKKENEERKADPRLGLVRIYEVYDRDAREVWLVPGRDAGCETVIGPLEWPRGIEGLPFSMIRYDDEEGYFWPNPILGPNHDLHTAVDRFLTHIMTTSRQQKTFFLTDSDRVKETDRRVIERAVDGGVYGIPGASANGVQQMQTQGVHPDHWRLFERVKALADELQGIDEAQRGVPSAGTKTATEISTASALSGVRLEDVRAAIFDCITEAARQLGALLIGHQDGLADLTLPVGRGADRRYVSYGGERLVGEALDYDYELEVAAVERVDKAVVQKRIEGMIAQSVDPNLGAKLQSEGVQFQTAPLIVEHLRSLGERNPSRYLVPIGAQPAAADQAAAEDQQMLETGEPVPVSPDDDHAGHLAQHKIDHAQTGSEAIAIHVMLHEQFLAASAPAPTGPTPSAPAPTGGPPPSGAGLGAAAPGAELASIQREVAA